MPETLPAAALGIFGGTFDPVHLAHLRLAEEAADALQLAGVRWIPAGEPRHRARPAASAQHRLAMVELALADNPRFTIDPAEVASGAASYTVPTLCRLRRELGATQPLVLLVGADAYAGLASWHRWQEIFALAHLAIAARPGRQIDAAALGAALWREHCARLLPAGDHAALHAVPAGKIVCFATTQLAISATGVRAAFAAGQSPRYLLPAAVIDYIHRHHLYQSQDES